jgi:hypothetical protein
MRKQSLARKTKLIVLRDRAELALYEVERAREPHELQPAAPLMVRSRLAWRALLKATLPV